jgi:WS/DGAT C-terminal domain
VAAGGLRRSLERQSQTPVKLKAMVPVSVRENGRAGQLGNRTSSVYVDLPCDEPDPVRRLRMLAMAMRQRKQGGEPEGGDAMLKALGYAPRPLQHVSRMVASPRAFNLVVSNIPGPPLALYMAQLTLNHTPVAAAGLGDELRPRQAASPGPVFTPSAARVVQRTASPPKLTARRRTGSAWRPEL